MPTRLCWVICLLVAAIAAGAVFVRQRLIDVQNQYAQMLQDTVKAEVAALRIGDRNAFLSFQGAGSDWRRVQRGTFQEYSRLKSAHDLEVTGNILAVAIEDAHARVVVQENIDELPYARLWFYRRTDNRWQHIEADYGFWGIWQQYERSRVRVNFREADRQFAVQLGDTISRWLEIGCELFGCAKEFAYTVDVHVEAAEPVARAGGSTNQLVMGSPYTGLARADTPFDSSRQFLAARLIADAFVDDASRAANIAAGSDAAFLRESVVSWLAERFTRIDSGALLIRSLAVNYGAATVAELVPRLEVTADMSSLDAVVPGSIAEADLDWRDFIAWRLSREDELIAIRAEANWLALVDTRSEQARLFAYERFNASAEPRAYLVRNQVIWRHENGEAQLRATFELADEPGANAQVALFNLVNDVWKRAG